MRLWLVIALLISGAAYGQTERVVDPALKPLFGRFIVDALTAEVPLDRSRLNDLRSITFAKLNRDTTLGVCRTLTYEDEDGKHRELAIEIDRDTWYRSSLCEQRALLYHELGHCLLGLAHSQFQDSLMFPNMMPSLTDTCEGTQRRIQNMFNDAKRLSNNL